MRQNSQLLLRDRSDAVLATSKLPQLPSEVWGAIAGHALAACDHSLNAWLRLRAVSRAWRQGLEGSCPASAQEVDNHTRKLCAVSSVLLHTTTS